MRLALFALAAILEISGCYLMWWGQKQHSTWLWLAGIVVLAGFGLTLAQVSANLPSRAYAAYGGIYIAASVLWMIAVDKTWPDKWDTTGVAISLAGTLIILFGPRS